MEGQYDFEIMRKTILINLISIIGILRLFFFGILATIQGGRLVFLIRTVSKKHKNWVPGPMLKNRI